MPVAVPGSGGHRRIMLMVVMRIAVMHVLMLVFIGSMRVLVAVAFGQV